MFYAVFFIGVLFAALYEKDKKGILTKVYAVIIAGVAMFRYGCGADYFRYGRLYLKHNNSLIGEITKPSSTHEVGFRLVETIFNKFHLPYQVFIAFLAIVTIYFIYKTCTKYCTNPTLGLLIYYSCYYIFWTYTALRQGLAITIGIYFLLEAVNNKKIWQFVIVTLLLSLLHYSALFFFILFLASKLKLDRKRLIIITVLCIFIGILPWKGVIHKLSEYISLLKEVAKYTGTSNKLTSIFDFQAFGRMGFLILSFIFYDKYSISSPESKRIIDLYIISLAIYFLLQFSEMTAARLSIYGKVLDIIILGNIFYLLTGKWCRRIYAAFLCTLLFAYLFKDLRSMEAFTELQDSNRFFVPYVNIFNKGNFIFGK